MSAHESSIYFASLLLSPIFRRSDTYELWKDIFPLLYGGTVEEVAQRGDELGAMLKGDM